MKKRNIPYGYTYINGSITVHEKEAEIILQLFDSYISGKSLSEISKRLNSAGVEYYSGVTGWNKSRISRILEDERYLGMDKCERIISDEVYLKAKNIKQGKNNQKYIDRKLPIYNLKVPVLCSECGVELKRKYENRCRCKTTWLSENHNCNKGIRIEDTEILEKTTNLLNWCILNTDKLSVNADIIPSDEVIKSGNEVQRMLSSGNMDDEVMLNSIYEDVKINYSVMGNEEFNTYRVQAAFRETGLLSDFSMDIFRDTVKGIILHSDKTLDIVLINNIRIEGARCDC